MSDSTYNQSQSSEVSSLNDVTEFKVGTLNPDKWIPKIDYRDRNRMKLTFKLDKEETAAYINFRNQTKPDDMDEGVFMKATFFLGLSTLETNISKKITDELEIQDSEVSIPPEEDAPENE